MRPSFFSISQLSRWFTALCFVLALPLPLAQANAPVAGDENWVSMGAVGGSVNAMAVHGSDVYVGGSFTQIGGVAVNNIAKWNGSAWSAVGSGMNGTVRALAIDVGGNLYAGGTFTSAGGVTAGRIAKWNGSNWSAMGAVTYSVDDSRTAVNALAFDASGVLYVAGFFNKINATNYANVAKWNGGWSTVGFGPAKAVHALVVDGGNNVYVGGEFSSVGVLPSKTVNYVAKWDGSSWSALASGMSGYVHALALDGSGSLYAGGAFQSASGAVVNRIAKWNGSSWSALGNGVDTAVYTLAFDGSDNLYAGGAFTAAGGVSANRIAKWNGTSWRALGSGTNSDVSVLALDDNGNLFVGGAFTTAGGQASAYLAKWVGGVDADGDGVGDEVDVFPLDPTETLDTDHDGIGNNADLDDDNDGVPDYIDAEPLNAANANERSLLLNAPFKGSSVREAAAAQ